MALQTITGVAPSHWASALINGDWSAISTEESIQVSRFRDWLLSGDSRGSVVSCSEESFFAHRHDATQFGVLAADCVTYQALVNSERS